VVRVLLTPVVVVVVVVEQRSSYNSTLELYAFLGNKNPNPNPLHPKQEEQS
jgi:hypothetical protein